MLCPKCQEREATVQLITIVSDEMKREELCEVCGQDFLNISKAGALSDYMEPVFINPEKIIGRVIRRDPRYTMDAYTLVRNALTKVAMKYFKQRKQVRLVSAAEVLEALRELAMEKFGPRAKTELNRMGLCRCEDFGEVLFNLIDAGLLGRRKEDFKKDFQGGYDFDTAFPAD